MARKRGWDIIHRWEGNPIISEQNVDFPFADICNAGAVKFEGEYILLVTVENLAGDYCIHLARSGDGRRFTVEEAPVLGKTKEEPFALYEDHGVMDARVTLLEDTYYLVYNATSSRGFRLGLAKTQDFQSFERVALISEPDTKAGVLFPRKIRGQYARLERPWAGASIWVSYSDDLLYWGGYRAVMTPRGGFWDPNRIGAATPPLEIDEGWLLIYYGIKDTSAGPLFRLGAAILEAEDPTVVKGRSNIPILSPRERYERIGDVPNLVFSCGAVIEPDREVKLYYGAANSCICLGTTGLDEVVQNCLESKEEF